MKPRTRNWLIGAAVLGFGALITLFFAIAILSGALQNGGDSIIADDTGTNISSTGSRWRVDKLPPHWNGSDSAHGQWYPGDAFEKLRITMQEVVDKYKLPADEFMGLLDLESAGNPYAVGPELNDGDHAIGLGQFTTGTSRRYSEFGDKPGDRASNRTNPVSAIQATARKVAFDRQNNNVAAGCANTDWSTLRQAYLGPQPQPANGKGCNGKAWEAYNARASNATYDRLVIQRAHTFENKKYVVRVTPTIATISTSTDGTVFSASNIKSISSRYLGIKYGGGGLKFDSAPYCLDCQTLVERTMIDALTPSMGHEAAFDVIYYTTRGGKKQHRNFPFPEWTDPEWPAVNVTAEVARSSGVESSLATTHWTSDFTQSRFGNPTDTRGNKFPSTFQYIPTASLSKLKGNSVIDGTIVGLLRNEPNFGVTHVGFLFSAADGSVIFRNASSPQRYGKVVDIPLTEITYNKAGGGPYYLGIIILRPDPSKLPK